MVRKIGVATSAAFTLALGAVTARADTVPFDFTGAVVDYTAPTTGLYSILAFGAQGGAFAANSGGLDRRDRRRSVADGGQCPGDRRGRSRRSGVRGRGRRRKLRI